MSSPISILVVKPLVGVLIAGCIAAPLAAQSAMPTGGTTNTLTIEGTVDRVSKGPDTLTVTTGDGLTQVFRLTSKLFVHDGKAQQDDELSDLHRGMAVVVHYSDTGSGKTVNEVDRLDGNGLTITEGRIVSIDRGRQEIKVALAGNRTETLKLSDRAAQHVGRDLDAAADHPIVVYHTDEKGAKVVHYFKKK